MLSLSVLEEEVADPVTSEGLSEGGRVPARPADRPHRLRPNARYTPATSLVEAEIDGARMLFSTRTGRLYRLNETADRVWMALRVVSPASAAAMLAAEFDVPMQRARADVMDLLQHLFVAGLVVPAR